MVQEAAADVAGALSGGQVPLCPWSRLWNRRSEFRGAGPGLVPLLGEAKKKVGIPVIHVRSNAPSTNRRRSPSPSCTSGKTSSSAFVALSATIRPGRAAIDAFTTSTPSSAMMPDAGSFQGCIDAYKINLRACCLLEAGYAESPPSKATGCDLGAAGHVLPVQWESTTSTPPRRPKRGSSRSPRQTSPMEQSHRTLIPSLGPGLGPTPITSPPLVP